MPIRKLRAVARLGRMKAKKTIKKHAPAVKRRVTKAVAHGRQIKINLKARAAAKKTARSKSKTLVLRKNTGPGFKGKARRAGARLKREWGAATGEQKALAGITATGIGVGIYRRRNKKKTRRRA